MDDVEELSGFRAENEDSQYDSQYISQHADQEVQQRWSRWWDLFLSGKRQVQGNQIVQEERK